MLMRIRLPELLEERGLSPYALSKQSQGRISMSNAYRLVRLRGRVQNFDADMLEALCDVLAIGPGDLFERGETKPKRKK
jgi:DNA-binding Xre family transcriptional regulator